MRPSATELFGPSGTPRVVVVGAGIGGIAAGVKLRGAGIETFTIYESSAGVGGTWWDNTYPGAEVDVHSDLYSYSFKSYNWTRTHARQPELQSYLEETVDEFGLRPHLQLGVTVCSATWDDDRHIWSVTLDSGAVDDCHVLISAVGFLNVPRYPDWPGRMEFEGPKFHTSRWEHQHDLSDKVVAVVGTGSTATQVVPAIQPTVRKLYVFQREPGWVMPKGERAFTEAERQDRRKPWRRALGRAKMRYTLEKGLWGAATFRPGTKLHEQAPADVSRLHQRAVRTPTRPAEGCHPDVSLPWQAAGHRQHLLPRLEGGQRRAGPQGRGGGDPVGHRRRRWYGASRRRDRDGHGIPGGELPGPPPCHGAGGTDSRRALGGRTAGLSRHDGARVPQLLHALRTGNQRR